MSETANIPNKQQVSQNAGVAPQEQYIQTQIEGVKVQPQKEVPPEAVVATYDKAIVSVDKQTIQQQSLTTKEDTQKQNFDLEVPVVESPLVPDEESKADKPGEAEFDDSDPYAFYNWDKEKKSNR